VPSLTVALAGNPNTGKTSVFNALTGSRQHVGNWPGKTVERKHGRFHHKGIEVEVIDLPGAYSMSAYSIEEAIARDFILNEKPDIVVAVVDASNLERNLYLVVQILEMQARLIVALNMSDRADALGYKLDTEKLSAEFNGAPMIRTVANRGQGIEALKEAIVRIAEERDVPLEVKVR
jgi:ferrous iron transport protein B